LICLEKLEMGVRMGKATTMREIVHLSLKIED